MKVYLQKNWKLITAILIFILVFGWIEIRPAYIKHICSWTKEHQDAQPGHTRISKEEPTKAQYMADGGSSIDYYFSPNYLNIPAQPAQPAKDWYQPATEKEYIFCLHNHGL